MAIKTRKERVNESLADNVFVKQARAYEERIEAMFKERMEAQGIKPLSVRYMNAQADFFAGAMATEGADEGVRKHPYWVICIMSGRPIVIERLTARDVDAKCDEVRRKLDAEQAALRG